MTGLVIDYRRAGVDRHACYLADTDDAQSAALALARRYETQGDTVTSVTVIENATTLADVEKAAQGPAPGLTHVFIFDGEEASA